MTTMPPRKGEMGMRKGTKSCLECRKRKIKCIFKDDETEVCVTCAAKGRNCTEQSKLPKQSSPVDKLKNTLEERVAHLEALVKSQSSVAAALSTDQSGTNNQSIQASQSSPANLEDFREDSRQQSFGLTTLGSGAMFREPSVPRPTNPRDIDPVGSLFDNAIWKQKKTNEGQVTTHAHNDGATINGALGAGSLTKSSRVCDQLCHDLPPPRLLASIIRITDSRWNTWRTAGSWLRQEMEQKNLTSLQEVVNWALMSSDPSIAAVGILCVAISLQQLNSITHSETIAQLPQTPGALFREYFDRVNRLVINDNVYSTSLAGIEVIKMSCQIFMNLGLLKMTWVLNHRAISHAQLLGLHRPHWNSTEETKSQMGVRQETWYTLCEHDLYTSLLLGLPYATDGKLISPTIYGSRVDRNQMGNELSTLETVDIERDMDSTANEFPADFWDAPAALHHGRITRPEYYDRLASLFWYFQMRVLLHQPLMIESIEDHQLFPNRNACLRACRDTLKIYQLMRSDTMSGFSMVKVIDYQTFLCSALLLLGLLGYGSTNLYSIDQYDDWETVQSILYILRQASLVSNDSFISQAVQGLGTLASLVEAYKTGVCKAAEEDIDTRSCFARISIPGTGVISIIPGKLLQKPTPPSSNSATTFAPPIFHLSHNSFEGLLSQGASAPYSQAIEQNNEPSSSDMAYDTPTMNFDIANMIDMDLDADWAWLVQANAGII